MRLTPSEIIENVLDYYDTNVQVSTFGWEKMFPDASNSDKTQAILDAFKRHGYSFARQWDEATDGEMTVVTLDE